MMVVLLKMASGAGGLHRQALPEFLAKDLPTPILELLWRGNYNTTEVARHELLD